jgi:signal transduction histidine kinase
LRSDGEPDSVARWLVFLRPRGFLVSEFERSRSSVPPFVPPVRPDAFVSDADLESPAFREPSFVREGLPAGFRMRHDAHYVDQLTSRAPGPHVRAIPIADIDSPRTDPGGDVAALAKSIQKLGILQPLLVRPRAGRFELIAGVRRLQAAAEAGLTEVPCLVHQVDDVRARAIAEADNIQGAAALPVVPAIEPAAPAPAAVISGFTTPGLHELGQSFDAIGSCLHLLGEREAALRDRVALDLVRTEVHRASRLVQGLRLLAESPTLAEVSVSLPSALDAVVESFASERRLSGVSIVVAPADAAHRVHADPECLALGLSGALSGMLALVQQARTPSLAVKVMASGSGSSVLLEIEQKSVTVPAWMIGRFFDAQWTDRPGGFQAAIELAAARRAIELHHGGIDLVAGDRTGARLVIALPAE